jgi:LAO/AO transport system kinase
LVPESGDSIQAMKAGLMEIADFFVMNKADRAGADQAVMSIRTILGMRKTAAWTPDVVKAVANEGTGIDEIGEKIAEHRSYLETSGGLRVRRRARLEDRIRDIIANRLHVDFWTPDRRAMLARRMDSVMDLQSNPYEIAAELITDFKR